jgi:hypothetical protein
MMIVVALLASSLFVTGCAVPIQTGVSLQPGHDLGEYTSFAWNQPEERPTGDARLDDNPLFVARVHAAIEWELTTRGIELARDGDDQFEMGMSGRALAVHHHTSIEDHVEVYEEDAGATFRGEYDEGARVDQSEEATFIVGLADAYTGALVWSGWAVLNFEKALADPSVMQRRVDAALAAMFESFPVPVGGAASPGTR